MNIKHFHAFTVLFAVRFIVGINGPAISGGVHIIPLTGIAIARNPLTVYDLRLHVKTSGLLGGENKNPGKPRGYDALKLWLYWTQNNLGHGAVRLANLQSDLPEWKTLFDPIFSYSPLNKSYIAPAHATGAVISLQLS